jgi:hypothetical protein
MDTIYSLSTIIKKIEFMTLFARGGRCKTRITKNEIYINLPPGNADDIY